MTSRETFCPYIQVMKSSSSRSLWQLEMKAVRFFKMVEVSNLATQDNNPENLNLHYHYRRYFLTLNTRILFVRNIRGAKKKRSWK